MKHFSIIAMVVGFTVAAWSLSYGGEALVKSFAAVAPSVGALYTQGDGGDLRFSCTSTVVASDEEETVLLTAGHCAAKNESYLVTFDGATFHRARVWKLPPNIKDFKYERSFGEPKVDMAFFKVIGKLTVKAIELSVEPHAVMGQDVVTLGFPLGMTKVGYTGTVAGIYTRPGDFDGYMMLQIFGAPGSSGSAVVDVRTNKVIAVLVAGKQGQAGLPVIFATPIDYARFLVPLEAEDKTEDSQ